MTASGGLPAPDAEAARLSVQLETVVRNAIRAAGGVIGFDQYMDAVLYTPGLGYYVAGARKFGPGGDFVTAPELTPLFSQCLAQQVAEVLRQSGDTVLELGAGSGAMAADLLAELARLDCLPRRYSILEPSPELRARQRQTLETRTPRLLQRVTWLSALPAEPTDGVILANEVLDAMPVRRFRVTESGAARPVGVCWREQGFVWQLMPPDPDLTHAVHAIQNRLSVSLPQGYESEFNPALEPWVRSVSDTLGQGLVLLIDYGYPRAEYYHAQRRAGTVMCHYRQRAHGDPLIYPGIQDVSASVDFTAVADAALASGLDLLGYTTQAWFLLNTGLDGRLAVDASDDPFSQVQRARHAQTLIMPGEMGERFKVMAFGRGLTGPLCGFAAQDQRHRL
jgi:SAM-dependent MidA family methyltransferase